MNTYSTKARESWTSQCCSLLTIEVNKSSATANIDVCMLGRSLVSYKRFMTLSDICVGPCSMSSPLFRVILMEISTSLLSGSEKDVCSKSWTMDWMMAAAVAGSKAC